MEVSTGAQEQSRSDEKRFNGQRLRLLAAKTNLLRFDSVYDPGGDAEVSTPTTSLNSCPAVASPLHSSCRDDDSTKLTTTSQSTLATTPSRRQKPGFDIQRYQELKEHLARKFPPLHRTLQSKAQKLERMPFLHRQVSPEALEALSVLASKQEADLKVRLREPMSPLSLFYTAGSCYSAPSGICRKLAYPSPAAPVLPTQRHTNISRRRRAKLTQPDRKDYVVVLVLLCVSVLNRVYIRTNNATWEKGNRQTRIGGWMLSFPSCILTDKGLVSWQRLPTNPFTATRTSFWSNQTIDATPMKSHHDDGVPRWRVGSLQNRAATLSTGRCVVEPLPLLFYWTATIGMDQEAKCPRVSSSLPTRVETRALPPNDTAVVTSPVYDIDSHSPLGMVLTPSINSTIFHLQSRLPAFDKTPIQHCTEGHPSEFSSLRHLIPKDPTPLGPIGHLMRIVQQVPIDNVHTILKEASVSVYATS